MELEIPFRLSASPLIGIERTPFVLSKKNALWLYNDSEDVELSPMITSSTTFGLLRMARKLPR